MTNPARARAGMASFTRLFQIPVMPTARVMTAGEKPNEWYIAAVVPTPKAKPTGTVFEMAVDA
jgi:hypothetical protein